jgi:hypothetical protein
MKCFAITYDSSLATTSHILVSRSNAYYFSVGDEKIVVADSAVSYISEWQSKKAAVANVSLRTQHGRTVLSQPTAYSAADKDAVVLLTITAKPWVKQFKLGGLDESQMLCQSKDGNTKLFIWRAGQELAFTRTGEETTRKQVRVSGKYVGIFPGKTWQEETNAKEETLLFRFDGTVFNQYTREQRVDNAPAQISKDEDIAMIELAIDLSLKAPNPLPALAHAFSLLEKLGDRAVLTVALREPFSSLVASIAAGASANGNPDLAERALKLGLHVLYASNEGLNLMETRKLFADALLELQKQRCKSAEKGEV